MNIKFCNEIQIIPFLLTCSINCLKNALFGNINYNKDEYLHMRHRKIQHKKRVSFMIVTDQKIITHCNMLLINTDYYI